MSYSYLRRRHPPVRGGRSPGRAGRTASGRRPHQSTSSCMGRDAVCQTELRSFQYAKHHPIPKLHRCGFALVSIRIRTPRFISVRIRILGANQMRIYAEPDHGQNLPYLNFIFLLFRAKMPVLGSKIFLVVTVCTLYNSIYLKFVNYPLIF
jgi:hypothetical protein